MIVYFADRYMTVLGLASAELPGGLTLYDDEKVEDIETGVASFSCNIAFEDSERRDVEEMTKAGNYLLRRHDGANEFYTIIDSEIDPLDHTVNIYAEDAGLDLLNEIATPFEATEAHPIAWYVEKYTYDTGFEIGINEIPDLTRKLKWEGEDTFTARLDSVATQFDNAELSYSFDIEGLAITHKYINIYKHRGSDHGVTLRVNHDLNNITIKQSIANLATALRVTGGTPEGKDTAITLSGYKYDDGDIYVSGEFLKCRSALAKWSRYLTETGSDEGHIVKTYSYDTTSQEELCAHAVTELKSICDMEVNYEVELAELPDNVRIGDTVNLVDENGELYVSARLLELKTSITNGTHEATFGDYLIKDSGISSKVEQLASQFAELAKNRTFYTWIVYADDASGTGISLDSTGKAYVGIATNRSTIDPDISDPSSYKWSKVEGSAGRSLESIAEHYLVSNLSEGITIETKGWVTLPIPAMSAENKYLWNYETLNYSDGSTEDLEPKIIGAFGDTGSKSPAIVAMTEQYYLSTSNTEMTGGEWVETIPEWTSGTYLWTRWAIEWDDPNPTIITYSEGVLATTFNEIHESAAAASAAATEAKESAASAVETATTAASEVAEANKQIDALTESLETVQTDMATNYATKGELTEVNTALGTEISQNAAQIESTATKVQEVSTNAEQALSDAAAAQAAADAAAQEAEDAQTKYTELKAQADITDEQLAAAQAAVEQAQADATAAGDAAALAQSAANALAERVTTAETQITQNAEAIELRATKTEVQESLDNLKIGGRNLALQSAAQQGGTDNPFAVYDVSEPLVAGTEYTCQINLVPADGVTDIKLYLSNGGQLVQTFAVTGTDEQTLTATFTAKYASGKTPDDDAENAKLKFYRYPTTVTESTVVNWVKVESGNKATDWTPAPEDMASSDDLSTAVESFVTNISEITQTTDSISERVSEQEEVTTALDSRTSTLESTITQTNESVETRFANIEQTISAQGTEIIKTETLIRETAAGIEIGKTDSQNKMQLDNDSLDFMLNGEKVAEYASDGLATKSVSADTQIALDSQWAFRLGAQKTSGQNNLNIVWIGG